MKKSFIIICFFLSCISLFSLPAVPYSGKVAIEGVNFEGTAKFTFSLYDKNGVTRWRNGNHELDTINVHLSKGRYTVLLGAQGMNPLSTPLFLEHDELYLKVRFDNGDGEGLRTLLPDQRITVTPRALVAEVAKVANTVSEGAITTSQLNEQILKYLKPEIISSPSLPKERNNIYSGQSFILSGSGEGKFLTYQWHRNGQPISGATGNSLQVFDVNASQHNGAYSLTVSNDFGSVVTQSVQVEVNSTRLYHTVPSASNMSMIWVEPGTFIMGKGGYEINHEVTLSEGYYLGDFEVTQGQYEAVMIGNSKGLNVKPSRWLNNNQRPVENVSYLDAGVFLSRLNQFEQSAGRLPPGWQYTLPSEAQWEYACRAGTSTSYSWGNDINSTHANYIGSANNSSGNHPNETVNVGQYASNAWGFFDMHGNVREWVYDWHNVYLPNAQIDPKGPAFGLERGTRGGSWSHVKENLRSGKRLPHFPNTRFHGIGFRVAFQKILPDTAKPEFELIGGESINHLLGQAWIEPGVGAYDLRDGNLSSSVVITGAVDVNDTGTYKLIYSVSDGAGNQGIAERNVTVVSNDLTFVAEISAYHSNKSFFETRNLKPFYETTITADNNSSAVNFDSWWREESETPNRPWSETNKADLDGTMKQTFPSMTSFSIEKFSDANVKETFNASIEWYNWYHMPKLFKFSQEIFTDAFKQKFPEGTKVRITYSSE